MDSPRSKTGIRGLHDILHGGLIEHRLHLIQGQPGSGKTTMTQQYLMEGVKAGETCLYITLSETKVELLAGAASHGWLLEGIEIVELTPDEDDLNPDTQLTMFQPSEMELGDTTKRIIAAVNRVNPSRAVFDSLSELRLLAQSPLRYRRQILALKQFFVGRKCTVLLLYDMTAESHDLQLQSIAHGVVVLEQFSPAYGAARRRLQETKFRGTDFRAGYHDYAIKAGGLQVYPRLVAAEHEIEFAPTSIKSGVTALDNLLGGGPDRGTSMLLVGPAGSGKSTVAIQFAVSAASRGDHAAIFAFDESAATLRARTAALDIELKEGQGKGEVSVRQTDPAEMSPGEFTDLVQQAVESDDARIVVIDSLNGYMHAMPEGQYLTVQLHELLTYLGRHGVTTLLIVAQHGMIGGDRQSPINASYLADSVVIFSFFEHQGRIKKAISVGKKRSGPHEESIRELRFSGDGIQLSEPLTQLRGIYTGVPVEAPPVASPAANQILS